MLMIIEQVIYFKKLLKCGIDYRLTLKKAYWSRGVDLAKQAEPLYLP